VSSYGYADRSLRNFLGRSAFTDRRDYSQETSWNARQPIPLRECAEGRGLGGGRGARGVPSSARSSGLSVRGLAVHGREHAQIQFALRWGNDAQSGAKVGILLSHPVSVYRMSISLYPHRHVCRLASGPLTGATDAK
jgi:hypothetical protein